MKKKIALFLAAVLAAFGIQAAARYFTLNANSYSILNPSQELMENALVGSVECFTGEDVVWQMQSGSVELLTIGHIARVEQGRVRLEYIGPDAERTQIACYTPDRQAEEMEYSHLQVKPGLSVLKLVGEEDARFSWQLWADKGEFDRLGE